MNRILSRITSILTAFEKVFVRISESLAIGCGVLAFLYMLWVTADVSGRFLLSMPIPCTVEVGQIVLVFVVFLALASVQSRGQHIRATILKEHFSSNLWAWLDILALAAGFLLIFLSAWNILPYAISSYKVNEADITYNIPIYPSKIAFFIGYLLLCIGFLISLARRIHARLADWMHAKKSAPQ